MKSLEGKNHRLHVDKETLLFNQGILLNSHIEEFDEENAKTFAAQLTCFLDSNAPEEDKESLLNNVFTTQSISTNRLLFDQVFLVLEEEFKNRKTPQQTVRHDLRKISERIKTEAPEDIAEILKKTVQAMKHDVSKIDQLDFNFDKK